MNNLQIYKNIPKGRKACLNIVDRNVQSLIYCYRYGKDVIRDKDCVKCRYQ